MRSNEWWLRFVFGRCYFTCNWKERKNTTNWSLPSTSSKFRLRKSTWDIISSPEVLAITISNLFWICAVVSCHRLSCSAICWCTVCDEMHLIIHSFIDWHVLYFPAKTYLLQLAHGIYLCSLFPFHLNYKLVYTRGPPSFHPSTKKSCQLQLLRSCKRCLPTAKKQGQRELFLNKRSPPGWHHGLFIG